MNKLRFDQEFKSGIWLFHPGPGPDAVAELVDGGLDPVECLLGIDLHNSTLEFGMPPHFFGFGGFEVIFASLIILDFVLDHLHDVEVKGRPGLLIHRCLSVVCTVDT